MEKPIYLLVAETVLKALADFPESISIEEKSDERGSLLLVRAAKLDFPKLIGKQGQNANALRKLLVAIGKRGEPRKYVTMKIIDPDRPESSPTAW